LGSTTLVTDASGNIVSELRYKPWGETRYNSGSTPTRYQYPGQYSYTPGFGLYFYNARWYDPALGRFTQPDSLIPEQSQGAQAWDRYAYVNNNPLRYNDPNGHSVDCGIGEPNCRAGKYVPPPPPKTVFEKALDGDIWALIELITPTHGGLRWQVEIAIPVFGVFGASVSVGGNIVYNYRSNQLAANLDWAVEPGVGIGGGISTTVGPLIGWLSTNAEDATSGFSGIISGTAAAEIAGTVAITFPLDNLVPC
jgi:RHS repeat-associated protein